MEIAIRDAEGETAAVKFVRELPFSKSADAKKKFEWAKAMCRHIEGAYFAEQIAMVRIAACRQPNERLPRGSRAHETEGRGNAESAAPVLPRKGVALENLE